MTNSDVVCLSCFTVGGALKSVDIEHIAIAAYEIAPSQFCWNYFPDRIDLRKVQYAMKNDILGPAPRLTGSLKKGYQLTPAGLEWCQRVSETNHDRTDDTETVASKIEAERRRLRMTSAFKKYISNDISSINNQDFNAFVRVNEYFPESLCIQRIAKIENVVNGDKELEEVWRALKAIQEEG